MDVILAAVVIILGTLGLCSAITMIGFWGTVKPRLEHKREMFVLHEKAKLTAIEVHERQLMSLDRVSKSS